MLWQQAVIILVVSLITGFWGYFNYRWGYAKGYADGQWDTTVEFEQNGKRREMLDANRTTLPREGARPAKVHRIRFNSKIK